MTVREQAVAFECDGQHLIGVLARGAVDLDTAVVVIVGGPQYRVGSHRQFVLLARRLAASGHPVLRFDQRGMGDSSGVSPGFEQIDRDVDAAIAALRRLVPAVRRVVLWGLCDGASAALLHRRTPGRAAVDGLCLVNPWVRSESSLARTHVRHYYLHRLRQREFWAKILAGRMSLRSVRELAANIGTTLKRRAHSPTDAAADAPFPQRMAQAWHRFPGPILLLLSAEDYTAKEFLECCRADPHWAGALQRPGVERHDLTGADHTLSDAASRARLEELTLAWLQHAVAERDARPPAAVLAADVCGPS